jgi:hypothetical protein
VPSAAFILGEFKLQPQKGDQRHTLLITPLAVRLLASTAGPMPVAVRLALRDLGRYRARSSSALAAITLALGIAAAVVVVANAEAQKTAAQPPNLSNRQIRVYPGPSGLPDLPTPRTPTELARLEAQVQRIARPLDHAAVTPLMVASSPASGRKEAATRSVFRRCNRQRSPAATPTAPHQCSTSPRQRY